MFKDLNDIRLLVAVARAGTLTRGAAALHMPVATASRRLAALEREIGARLIERHARRFSLTDLGQTYLAVAQRALEEIDRASEEVAGLSTRPGGHLRIAAPADFATAFLAEPVASFAQQYPDITLSLELAARRVSLIEEGFDVAIRMGTLPDSMLTARHLIALTRGLYASPAYAQRTTLPSNPKELGRCCVVSLQAYLSEGQLTLHRIERPATAHTVAADARITVNSMAMLRQLLLAGAGIALVPDRLMQVEVKLGRAVRILPEWQAPAVHAHLLYRSRLLLPPRVRLFVDHLTAAFPAGS